MGPLRVKPRVCLLQVRQVADGNNSEMPAVPITVRQLEAVVRISEALARMQLLVQATEAHVRFAIDLFKTSTMDAVRSGVIDITVSVQAISCPSLAESISSICNEIQCSPRIQAVGRQVDVVLSGAQICRLCQDSKRICIAEQDRTLHSKSAKSFPSRIPTSAPSFLSSY